MLVVEVFCELLPLLLLTFVVGDSCLVYIESTLPSVGNCCSALLGVPALVARCATPNLIS